MIRSAPTAGRIHPPPQSLRFGLTVAGASRYVDALEHPDLADALTDDLRRHRPTGRLTGRGTPAGHRRNRCRRIRRTDIDDIIVLTVLFLACRATGVPSMRHIVGGQYLGIAALVAASAIAAAGLLIVPQRWVGVLGLATLTLGVRGLILAARDGDPDAPVAAAGLLSVTALTIANGADNLSVYIPLFRTIGLGDSLATIAVFAVLVAVWLAAGFWLGSHKQIVAVVERFRHWLVPIVFVAIGVLILVRSGLIAHAIAAF